MFIETSAKTGYNVKQVGCAALSGGPRVASGTGGHGPGPALTEG